MSDKKSPEKVIIIGSGPAAWTAAIYAARAALDPLVYEGFPSREMIPGGQLMFTTEVENYPGFPTGVDGQDMMMKFKEQATRVGTRVITEDIVEVDFTAKPLRVKPSSGEWIETHSVIISTGARANWLGVPGEERLARQGGGVSACATCDAALPVYRDAKLAVIGGGDSALTELEHILQFASEGILIHRRDELRASKILQERVLSKPGVRVEWNTVVKEMIGGDFVEQLLLEDTVTGEQRTMDVGGVFVAIGHTPNTAFLEDQVELKPNGYIRTVENWRTKTSVPGVFAAGDVMDDYYRQAVSAAGTGCMAALDAEHYLRSKIL